MTETTATLTATPLLLDETDPAALYCHYHGQTAPQSCYVTLDLRDGELTAWYNPEIGNSCSVEEYHGIIRTYRIPLLTAAAANRLLTDLTPVAQRVLDGASVEWDGNNNIGVLTDAAAAAEDEITALCDGDFTDDDLVGEMDAADWWSEGDLPEGLTATVTDEELDRIAENEEREAATINPGHTVLIGAAEYLAARREQMQFALAEELEELADEIDEKMARRDELIAILTRAGVSSRHLGRLVNRSHVAVQKIAKRVNAPDTASDDTDTDD